MAEINRMLHRIGRNKYSQKYDLQQDIQNVLRASNVSK